MDAVQNCIDRLRELAESGSAKPREDAAAIMRNFNEQASDADREKLKRRLDDALLVGRNTVVSYLFYSQHLALLAVLEGAPDAA